MSNSVGVRRTALVTGATSGIGRAVAEQLAKDGFEVFVHGRDAVRGKAVVASILEQGGDANLIIADLADAAEVTKLAEEVGAVDVLVNNAGFAWFGPSELLDAEGFDALFAINVRATYLLTASIAPQMATRGSGSVINVSSMAAQIGLNGGAAYSATKAALSTFTRSWAVEFGASGVRVNAVAPGPVLTGASTPDRTAQLGATTILGRAGTSEEVASLVSFLASEQSSYITGTVIAVDGGRTAI